jgi:hypothetical protein
MSDIIPTATINIQKLNNGGYSVNTSTLFDGSNKYEVVCFTTAKEVGDYISNFLSQLPTPKSDLFELTNPNKIPIPVVTIPFNSKD